jgi:hypothetical protein
MSQIDEPTGGAREPLAAVTVAILIALAAGLLGLVVVLVLGIVGSSPAPSSASTVLTVRRGELGREIPAGFTGLSMEYTSVQSYAGSDPRALHPAFLALVRDLAPGQRPVLRIGGDSTDWVWWPIAGVARPAGIKYALTPRLLAVIRALTGAVDARMILGVNLEADSRELASGEARALIAGVGRRSIEALEVGNEPELYGSFNWYRLPDGRGVKGRPPGYDPARYAENAANVARALPKVPLAGPGIGAPKWIAQLSQIIRAGPRVGVVTLHAYPLRHCRAASTQATIPHLLADSSSTGLARSLSRYASIAHAHGLPLRIDEMNAVSCGGRRGVSDTFATALWSLDTLFALVRAGVDGVNVHTNPGKVTDLFGVTDGSSGWHAFVHPEYYGMMMFAQATPPGSRLLGLAGKRAAGLSAWATLAPRGAMRVVLINKSLDRPQVVRVRLPSTTGLATLERLQASSAAATSGVTLGGRGFGADTATGKLAGQSTVTPIAPTSLGYRISLPAASAAMLTIASR